MTNASLTCVWKNANDPVTKQSRIESSIIAHDISWMGHMLVAIDAEGQVYTYRVTYPNQDPTAGQHLNYAVSLLEYCLVSGYDALDVSLLIKQHPVESVVDRLTENFTRQPAYVQQQFYVQFYAMKTYLYRLLAGGSQRSQDLTSFLMLHSILIGFKCLLRPADISRNDKGPAENLASKAFIKV